jgi:hypothetical protein
MNIKKTFLKLTRKTYPYGFEDQLVSYLPSGYFKDVHGNYYYQIGSSKTAFACHLDTACKTQVNVVHKFNKNIISTDGKSILGADDKAGMTVLLYMIYKRIPGLYCFFIGEEVGCIGSGKACDDDVFTNYDRMISFDRRGTKSVITFQSSKRCCSDEFAESLSKEFNKYSMNMEPDNTGVYTDSAEFTHVIPECTNISVGYYKEHTHLEHQDIDHLIKLCLASVKIDWESLPVKRDPKQIEYKSYSYGSYSSKGYSSYDYDTKKYDRGYSTYDSWSGWDKSPSNAARAKRKKYQKTYGYYDDFYFEDEDHCAPSGKSYLNDLDSEIEIRNPQSKNYYEPLKQSLMDDRFSNNEISKISEQYFDSTKEEDREAYLDLVNYKDDFPY